MKNKDLMQDAIEKWGEEAQLDMIVDKSLILSTAIQNFKKVNLSEDDRYDGPNYSIAYNEVCERIADMKVMIEQAEFLFNTNEINNHYKHKIEYLREALNDY